MRFSKVDLPNLKWSLGAFVLSLTLAGVLFYLSEAYLAHAIQDREDAQKQLTDAQVQLAAAQNDQQNMAIYAMEYNALMVQKVIGDEQRLDWMEGLEKLRQQGRVLDFTYTISPQQAYAPSPPLDAGNFQLNRSGMTMQINLLHEGQLLDLIAAMRTQMKGWFMLDSCALSRVIAGNDASPLKAECKGGWFTMKNRNTP